MCPIAEVLSPKNVQVPALKTLSSLRTQSKAEAQRISSMVAISIRPTHHSSRPRWTQSTSRTDKSSSRGPKTASLWNRNKRKMRGMLNQSHPLRRLDRSCIKKDSCKEGDSSPTITKVWKSMSNSTSQTSKRAKDKTKLKASCQRLKSARGPLSSSWTQHQRWSCHSLSMSETDSAHFSTRSRRLERANLASLIKSLKSKMALFGLSSNRKRSTSEWETAIWDAKRSQRPFRYAP